MPRQQKPGLSYFPLDVDFFTDNKIRILRARFGNNGIAVYIYLLCEIYKKGYYMEWNDDFKFILAADLNLSDGFIEQENKIAVGETGMTAVGHKKGLEKDKETDLLEYRGKLGQIQNIEDALTRVQARKQAAIDALHRYGVDDARLEIEAKRLEMAARKSGDLDEEEQEDDGFLEALDSSAADDWRNDESLKENAENEEETSNI